MPRKTESETIDIAGHVQRETEKAYLFHDGVRDAWLPKSQVEWDADKGVMAVPEWLAKERELV